MSAYIQQLLEQHLHPAKAIAPRLPGKFEQMSFAPQPDIAIEDTLVQSDKQGARTITPTPGSISKPDISFDQTTSNRASQPGVHFDEPKSREMFSANPDSTFNKESGKDRKEKQQQADPFARDTHEQFLMPPNEPTRASRITDESGSFLQADSSENAARNEWIADRVELRSKPGATENVKQPQAVNTATGYLNANRIQGLEMYNSQGFSKNRQTPDPASRSNQESMNTVIKISIGRIDVQATPAAAPSKMPLKSTPKPTMSLEDYLRKRNNT